MEIYGTSIEGASIKTHTFSAQQFFILYSNFFLRAGISDTLLRVIFFLS
jgi:hypothetical protein